MLNIKKKIGNKTGPGKPPKPNIQRHPVMELLVLPPPRSYGKVSPTGSVPRPSAHVFGSIALVLHLFCAASRFSAKGVRPCSGIACATEVSDLFMSKLQCHSSLSKVTVAFSFCHDSLSPCLVYIFHGNSHNL